MSEPTRDRSPDDVVIDQLIDIVRQLASMAEDAVNALREEKDKNNGKDQPGTGQPRGED